MIKWYINRLHVGTPDEDIIKDFFARCQKAGWHPLAAVAVCEEALRHHHANRDHYDRVMSGRF